MPVVSITSINSMFPGCFRVILYSCSCQPDETFYRVLYDLMFLSDTAALVEVAPTNFIMLLKLNLLVALTLCRCVCLL